MAKGGYLYIITNQRDTTIYTGVSSELIGRIMKHKEKVYPNSFSDKYNLNKLIYFETFQDIESSIEREKQIKSWSRKREKLFDRINKYRLGGSI